LVCTCSPFPNSWAVIGPLTWHVHVSGWKTLRLNISRWCNICKSEIGIYAGVELKE
jgi:hypothetical protein